MATCRSDTPTYDTCKTGAVLGFLLVDGPVGHFDVQKATDEEERNVPVCAETLTGQNIERMSYSASGHSKLPSNILRPALLAYVYEISVIRYVISKWWRRVVTNANCATMHACPQLLFW